MALIDSLIVFVVSLLIGAIGIYLGARIVTNTESFEKAAITALGLVGFEEPGVPGA